MKFAYHLDWEDTQPISNHITSLQLSGKQGCWRGLVLEQLALPAIFREFPNHLLIRLDMPVVYVKKQGSTLIEAVAPNATVTTVPLHPTVQSFLGVSPRQRGATFDYLVVTENKGTPKCVIEVKPPHARLSKNQEEMKNWVHHVLGLPLLVFRIKFPRKLEYRVVTYGL